MPNPDTLIDFGSCWHKTIIDSDVQIRRLDPNNKATRLSVPEPEVIRHLVMVGLINKDGLTYDKLTFEEFISHWWSQESVEQAE